MGDSTLDMSGYLNDIARSVPWLSNDDEAPIKWNWNIVYGLVLGTVSIIQVLGWTRADDSKLLVQWITNLIYNLYFHPLAKFPGPLIGRSSLVSYRFVIVLEE